MKKWLAWVTMFHGVDFFFETYTKSTFDFFGIMWLEMN